MRRSDEEREGSVNKDDTMALKDARGHTRLRQSGYRTRCICDTRARLTRHFAQTALRGPREAKTGGDSNEGEIWIRSSAL